MATNTTKKSTTKDKGNTSTIFDIVKIIPVATRGGRAPSQYDRMQGRKKFFEAVAFDKLTLSGDVRQAILKLPHTKNYHIPHYNKELVLIEIVPSKEAGGEKMVICLNMTTGEVAQYPSIVSAKRETEKLYDKGEEVTA